MGISKAYDKILVGTYILLPDISQYTKEFLEALARLTLIENPPKAVITTEKFITG